MPSLLRIPIPVSFTLGLELPMYFTHLFANYFLIYLLLYIYGCETCGMERLKGTERLKRDRRNN